MPYYPRRAWPSIEHLEDLGFQWSDTNPIVYNDRCATCGGERKGRRTVYCSDECNWALQGRIYANVHWIRRAVVKRGGAICAGCGEKLSSPVRPGGPEYPDYDRIDIDHIVALIDGGTDHADNLQVLCRDCHKLKSKKDWRKRCGKSNDMPATTPTLEGIA